MNKKFKEMTREEALASFRDYEKYLDIMLKKGKMSREEVRFHYEKSKKNYSILNYNRELDKLKRDENA